jgi:hypothetical protein
MARILTILLLFCSSYSLHGQKRHDFKTIAAAEQFFTQKIAFTLKAIDSCYSGYTLTKFDLKPDGSVEKIETVFGEFKELNTTVMSTVRKSDKMWSKIYSEKVRTVLLPVYFINNNETCINKETNTGNFANNNFTVYKHVLNSRFSLQNCLFLQGINIIGGNRIQ